MNKKDLPSFSMVLETANLEVADLANLRPAMTSIAAQSVDIGLANEIYLVHGGDVPDDLTELIGKEFPWATLFPVPEGTGYGQAKMAGAKACTGDILVFFDSDCIYEPDWLENLLSVFRDHADIGGVGGETQMYADSGLGLASSVLFTFGIFSGRNALYEHQRLHLNNAAFRRRHLLEVPIGRQPGVLAAGGVSTTMLVDDLRRNGVKIVRSPFARSVHAAPNGLRHFFWRFLNMGYDGANFYRQCNRSPASKPAQADKQNLLIALVKLSAARMAATLRNLSGLLRQAPRRWLLLPLALPMLAFGIALQFSGYVLGMMAPSLFPRIVPSNMKRGTSFDARA